VDSEIPGVSEYELNTDVIDKAVISNAAVIVLFFHNIPPRIEVVVSNRHPFFIIIAA
jgi:hypothetical protein